MRKGERKMKKITLEIDGTVVTSEEGATILEAAKAAGITIPTLCYNEKLKPYGACRLCMVEITRGNKKGGACCQNEYRGGEKNPQDAHRITLAVRTSPRQRVRY
jgi:predicted molibdopterin-dependent oxidoreductase YjgC